MFLSNRDICRHRVNFEIICIFLYFEKSRGFKYLYSDFCVCIQISLTLASWPPFVVLSFYLKIRSAMIETQSSGLVYRHWINYFKHYLWTELLYYIWVPFTVWFVHHITNARSILLSLFNIIFNIFHLFLYH